MPETLAMLSTEWYQKQIPPTQWSHQSVQSVKGLKTKLTNQINAHD